MKEVSLKNIIYITDRLHNLVSQLHDEATPNRFLALFDAIAEGRLLILSPWAYDSRKKHVTRAECVEMNKMAEEIASSSIVPNGIRDN